MAAERRPAFQFYPKDFLTDEKVVLMSNTEVGIYLRLLCFCWLERTLPIETESLAQMARIPIKQFTKLWEKSVLRTCFQVGDDGRLHHKRLDEERTKQTDFQRRQSDLGAAGAEKRWGRHRPAIATPSKLDRPAIATPSKQNGPAIVSPMGFDSSPSSSPSPYVPPNPPDGGLLVDERIATLAGDFLSRYPAVYQRAKSGATYHVREARDHPYAMDLVAKWPDLDYLEKMLELFLRKADWSPKNVPGSPGQFRHMAPECDALLRQHGHAPRANVAI